MSGNLCALRIRAARREDARVVARLFALAGSGMPEYLWAQESTTGETPIDVGARRAMRDQASFSWRNADVAELDGRVAGLMLGYPTGDPTPEGRLLLPRVPAMVQPLIELEFEAPRSYYINALAVFENCRGRGIGKRLVAAAIQRAAENGLSRVCVQVFEHNRPALALYRHRGFALMDRRPMQEYPLDAELGDTLLLCRKVSRG
ncbi:MAG: GNAT family N-acetyltransferase [Halofilum sp. (in: g-proteobacteria)]